MADVRIEPGLALDAGLQLVHHRVEGAGQAHEVRICRLGLQPGVELAPGNGDRGAGYVGQRAQRSSTGESTQAEAEHGGHEAGDHQGQPDHPQGVAEVRQREHLEVRGIDGGNGHADHDLWLVAAGLRDVRLGGRIPGQDVIFQLGGER